jgi:hypothetical protein
MLGWYNFGKISIANQVLINQNRQKLAYPLLLAVTTVSYLKIYSEFSIPKSLFWDYRLIMLSQSFNAKRYDIARF